MTKLEHERQLSWTLSTKTFGSGQTRAIQGYSYFRQNMNYLWSN